MYLFSLSWKLYQAFYEFSFAFSFLLRTRRNGEDLETHPRDECSRNEEKYTNRINFVDRSRFWCFTITPLPSRHSRDIALRHRCYYARNIITRLSPTRTAMADAVCVYMCATFAQIQKRVFPKRIQHSLRFSERISSRVAEVIKMLMRTM